MGARIFCSGENAWVFGFEQVPVMQYYQFSRTGIGCRKLCYFPPVFTVSQLWNSNSGFYLSNRSFPLYMIYYEFHESSSCVFVSWKQDHAVIDAWTLFNKRFVQVWFLLDYWVDGSNFKPYTCARIRNHSLGRVWLLCILVAQEVAWSAVNECALHSLDVGGHM